MKMQDSSISPAELSLLLASGAPVELIDVRTAPEFIEVHVPGATLIPLDTLDVDDHLNRHRRGQPVYVICQAGVRAKTAIEKMKSGGCDDGVLVEGGTQAWIDAGLPVVRGASRVLPLMRQVQLVVGVLASIGALLALLASPWFALLPLALGCGLLFAGATGWCGMALLLARMPWNRQQRNSKLCMTEEGR